MAVKKAETAAAMKQRHVETLARAHQHAYDPRNGHTPPVLDLFVGDGQRTYRRLRAAVYAVVPGRQKAKNIGKLLNEAVAAVARMIRRRR